MTDTATLLGNLELDGSVSRSPSALETHAGDFGTPDPDTVDPDVVVYAESTADISAVLELAWEHGMPVTPYAAGTGVESGATPVEGGISLDTTGLDDIREIRPDDLQIDVEAGVVGADVNEALSSHGLFLPPLPSSGDISTIGGMLATDASGMKTVKYGEVADWALELDVVQPDGAVVTVGSRAAKTSSGYNLKDLYVGSEGTLGVITRATLRVTGLPEQIRGGRATFPTLADATKAISDAVTAGVDVAKIELVDDRTAAIANAYADTELPERPLVFVEFHANHGIEEEIAFCRQIFEAHDVTSFEMAAGAEMDQLWEARKEITYAAEAYDPDRDIGPPGDVTVPISRYPAMIDAIRTIADAYDFFVPAFGHAGDGNIHYFVLADYDDPVEADRAGQAHAELVERAIELGGTATGEHGIGTGKRAYLEREHGEAGVAAMRAIKQSLDPEGIMNPGKVLPPTEESG